MTRPAEVPVVGRNAAPDAGTVKPFVLSMASEDQPLRIHAIHGGKGLVLRLTELGLNLGAEIRVIQRQGGGLLIARGGSRIAIGGGMATKILVVPCQEVANP